MEVTVKDNEQGSGISISVADPTPTPQDPVGSKYYDPKILIIAPTAGAILPGSFTVSGTASCDLMRRVYDPSTDLWTGVFYRHANEAITNVSVKIGSANPINATPTGPQGTPWTSWTLDVTGKPNGAYTIMATVTASGSEGDTGTASASKSVTVDVSPPTLTINPPADVVAPPYVATITGEAADTPAGVYEVEWQFGGGAWSLATGKTNWSTQVTLPGLGLHTVNFRARDTVGNLSGVSSVTVRVGDVYPPTVNITYPHNGETIQMVGDNVQFFATGTASDSQTGVAKVEWALDGGAFTQATPTASGWSTWRTGPNPITIDTVGEHVIEARATDNATPAKTYTIQRAFIVAELDPEAVFSPTAYLEDLLIFSTKRAKASTSDSFITPQLLVDNFLQPFVNLVERENRAVAKQSVSQVRLCIETLRRYMAKNARSVPASAESKYRQTVYLALLRQLGTSYDEIRLARVADASVRDALAARLGIATARLDELLLQPADLTEVALKNLFGLEETTARPLADSLLPECSILIWQRETLRSAWQRQDDAARTDMNIPAPVIDPDMLSAQDLRAPQQGNVAYDRWKERRDNLAAKWTAIDTLRKAQPTQLAGFDFIVEKTLGPVAQLLALLEKYRNGDSIDSQLRARKLTIPAFLHLMRVRELVVPPPPPLPNPPSLLDEEWNDVYAILIQVEKLRMYADWRDEERQNGLIFGPDYFQLSGDNSSQIASLPRWRSTPQLRQAWRRTLDSRIQQELALAQGLQSAVSAAEQDTLPMLRAACIAAIAGDRDVAVIADQLTLELAIDCKDSGHLRTTRAQQSLATLQEVLLSLRLGRFRNTPPVLGDNPAANWVLAIGESVFDEEWRWMSGYGVWNAAMRVFAYPENYLLPELRPKSGAIHTTTNQTGAFRQLMTGLRNRSRLTAEQARGLAKDYLEMLTTELGADLPEQLRSPGFVITEQLNNSQLDARRDTIRGYFNALLHPVYPPTYLQEIFFFVPLALALQLQKSGQYLAALDWIETFYTDHFAPAERKIYRGLVVEESLANRYERNPENWLQVGLNPHETVLTRANSYTRFTIMTLVRCYLDFADAEFTRDEVESVARARALYNLAIDLLALPEMQPPAGSPFPPNPAVQPLKRRAELNLFKLRSGRNIAGIERQLTPLTEPGLMLDRLPTDGDAKRLFRPTPYRYAVLVERARNIVSAAQQVEQAYLAALERRDAESYNLFKAGHDLNIAGENVKLQGLRVKEAEQSVVLAESQRDRASIQYNEYDELINAGLNQWEKGMLDEYRWANSYRNITAGIDAALTTAEAIRSASGQGMLGTGLGAQWFGVGVVGVLAAGRAATTILANNAETSAQINSATASFERRKQEWVFQRQLAQADYEIGQKQVDIANTHKEVADQEAAISTMQHDQAQETVNFLVNKFTSAELYDWMSGVLGGVYSYFLQQATATAQLAQYQLGFERQEIPPSFIKADYWVITDEMASPPANGNAQPDRRGLTGSVRLLQDITRLDQFAFETSRRKLQLAETFSLARLFPLEFQQFRESGRLPFATPMSLFDCGFPGHYLRLIKRVRVSIIGLIPPVRGVRATLISSGISRVVTGGDVFQSVIVRRDP
ncbi:MAG: Ig-like domain-containing protein, partial [Blastocatellia bacterium]